MIIERLKSYKELLFHTSFKILVWKLYRKISEIGEDILRNSKVIKKSYHVSDKDFFRLLRIKGDQDACIDLLKEKINKNLFLNSIIGDTDKKYIVSKLTETQKSKIIKQADEICRHKFDLLGSGIVKISYSLEPVRVFKRRHKVNISKKEIMELKKKIADKAGTFFKGPEADNPVYRCFDYEPIDWHVDFRSGYRWDKDKWYRKFKYGGDVGVEVKNPWELSRFHHFTLLGQAYLITKNENYCLEYLFQLVDWITSNYPYFGINWRSILDVALRVSNWIVGLSFFKGSKFINGRFLLFLLKNIYIHGKHIADNLEYHSITSNHYISNISGLFFIGEILGDFIVGKRWSDFAISELKKEIDKQVYEDGADFESSTCYQRFILELFFYPVLFSVKRSKNFNGKNHKEIAKKEFGEHFINKILKMFEFMLFILKPDGRSPQIGDNDNGQFLVFQRHGVLDMRYLLTFGAVFFKDKRFKVKEYGFDSEALWVFGRSGYEVWSRIKHNNLSDIRSNSFNCAGLYVMRKNSDYLVACCSQNGQNGNGGHAHNDKLSFELSVDKKDIIIDPGSYIYTALPKWRNKFRSTSYHNTVMVDGQEQNRFKPGNLFSLKNDSRVIVRNWKTLEEFDYLEAEHNGYSRLNNSVIHKRQFVFNKRKKYWVIRDTLIGEGKHKMDIFFQLGQYRAIRIDKRTLAAMINFGEKVLKVIPVINKPERLSVEEGWYSSGYGTKTRSKVLKYSKTSVLPVEFLFVLSLRKSVLEDKEIREIFSKFNNRL